MSDRSDELVNLLKAEATVDDSEGISDEMLLRWIRIACTKHCPSYTPDDLPVEEEEGVLLLSQIDLAYKRASIHTSAPDVAVGGVGTHQESVYTRNMKTAASLQTRYDRLTVIGGGGEAAGSTVTQGTLFRADRQSNAYPKSVGGIIKPLISKGTFTSTSVILKVTMREAADFADYSIYCRVGGVNSAPSNMARNQGVPRLSNQSVFVVKVSDPAQKEVEVEGLLPNTEYFFIAVRISLRGTFSYSPDLRVMTPASD